MICTPLCANGCPFWWVISWSVPKWKFTFPNYSVYDNACSDFIRDICKQIFFTSKTKVFSSFYRIYLYLQNNVTNYHNIKQLLQSAQCMGQSWITTIHLGLRASKEWECMVVDVHCALTPLAVEMPPVFVRTGLIPKKTRSVSELWTLIYWCLKDHSKRQMQISTVKISYKLTSVLTKKNLLCKSNPSHNF